MILMLPYLLPLILMMESAVAEKTPIFRLGSGAVVTSMAKADQLGATPPSRPSFDTYQLQRVLILCLPLAVIFSSVLMVPAGGHGLIGGGSRDFNYRIPPSWSPENEHIYSFRAYMTDISQWVMLTDLQPHQQCAALIMRLGGSAREMARMIAPQEMYHGGSFEPGGR